VLVVTMRWINPPVSALMLAELLAGEGPLEQGWVPIEGLSENLALAVIAAEDQRFAEHHGFDLQAIQAALEEQETRGRLRGASTISQQVAKNLFLWRERSWLRKGLEAYFTALIELAWPKRRILEVYLNLAQFGPRTYGAEAAARRYFGKSARGLSPGEAARLAAVLPSPEHLSPNPPSPYVQSRAAWIERQMWQLGARYLDGIL
jgi:monofunctional biosynthetic peptidoglycan transglycosylase